MYQHTSHEHRLIRCFSPSHGVEANADKHDRWSIPSGPDRRLNELIRASAERRLDTAHTMQALEKYKPMLPVPCRHSSPSNVGRPRRPRREKQAGAEGEGDENTHHSAHQTPGSAFLNPRASAPARAPHPTAPPPAPTPNPAPTHPPCARNPRPWVRAVHDSSQHPLPQMFSQSIHFRDPFSGWEKKKQKKKPPCNPLTECASHFSECVNNFWLAGQTRRPGDVCRVCVSRLCVCDCCSLRMCVFIPRLCVFEYIYVSPLSFPLYAKQEEKGHVILAQVNQGLHTGEGCRGADLPDHVNEVPWRRSHWSIIDLFVSYLPNRHSDPEHVCFAMRNVKKDWKFPQRAH